MISWPVIIYLEGDDELVYVSNEKEWLSDDIIGYIYGDNDYLVDSSGYLFSLPYNKIKKVTELKQSHSKLSLLDFQKLVLNHLSILSHCCISKVTISTYCQGVLLVGTTVGE